MPTPDLLTIINTTIREMEHDICIDDGFSVRPDFRDGETFGHIVQGPDWGFMVVRYLGKWIVLDAEQYSAYRSLGE